MISPGDSCRVISHEPKVLTIGWDGIEYPLMPNVETIVPAEAVINAFGDPRSSKNIEHVKDLRGRDGWVVDRETEFRRMQLRYGIENGGSFPDVTVRSVLGDPIVTVIDDPEGRNITPATISQMRQETMEQMMSRMQQELDNLRAQAGINQSIIAEDELPADNADIVIPERHKVTPKAAYDDEMPEDMTGE